MHYAVMVKKLLVQYFNHFFVSIVPKPDKMKINLLLIACFFMCTHTQAQFLGPNSPQQGNNEGILSGAGLAWTDLNNAGASDNNFVTSGSLSESSRFTGRFISTDFGFSVPGNATIFGISVLVERAATAEDKIKDHVILLIKSGTDQTNDIKKGKNNWPTVKASASYGSNSDLWNNTWTPAEINSPDFGVAIAAERFDSTGPVEVKALIDHITITVYYGIILPVSILNFAVIASSQPQWATVSWKSINEQNISHYEIEHSQNGTTFSVLKKINSTATNSNEKDYNVTGVTILPGNNFYRLKMVDFGGKTKESNIILFKSTQNSSKAISLISNLVKNEFKIRANNKAVINNPISIKIIDETGRLIQTGTVIFRNTGEVLSVPLKSTQSTFYYLYWQQDNLIGTEKIILL